MTTLQYNVSLTWPDPVLDFYPLSAWSPKQHQTSRGSWSSAENSGSAELSGVYLSNFNASSLAVTGTAQWSNLYYNASLVPDGQLDNVITADMGDDLTYGFKYGNVLFEQGDLSDKPQTLDLNEGPDMQDSTYEAYTNILSVELVVITIDIPAKEDSQVVVNQTLSLDDFQYSENDWSMVNESLTPSKDQAQLDISFSGTNFFLVSGWASQPGFEPLTATLDGIEQPSQGRSHSRQAWEDGVLLFFSGLEDTNHTLSVKAVPPTAVKYGLVFSAGEASEANGLYGSSSSHHHSSASRTGWSWLNGLILVSLTFLVCTSS